VKEEAKEAETLTPFLDAAHAFESASPELVSPAVPRAGGMGCPPTHVNSVQELSAAGIEKPYRLLGCTLDVCGLNLSSPALWSAAAAAVVPSPLASRPPVRTMPSVGPFSPPRPGQSNQTHAPHTRLSVWSGGRFPCTSPRTLFPPSCGAIPGNVRAGLAVFLAACGSGLRLAVKGAIGYSRQWQSLRPRPPAACAKRAAALSLLGTAHLRGEREFYDFPPAL
jgi:hypothetical protein